MYLKLSGQHINSQKSGFFFSKSCPDSDSERLVSVLEMSVCEEDISYLGNPLFLGRNKSTSFTITKSVWEIGRMNDENDFENGAYESNQVRNSRNSLLYHVHFPSSEDILKLNREGGETILVDRYMTSKLGKNLSTRCGDWALQVLMT